MTNEIVVHDTHFQNLRAATHFSPPPETNRLPSTISQHGVADTYFVLRRDGTGASTLALLLEPYFAQEPLIAEVGTITSRALQYVDKSRRLHDIGIDRAAMSRAMDWRLKNPSRPAIIEVGKAIYKEAIAIAQAFADEPYMANVVILFIAGEHDQEFKVAQLARRLGLENTLVLGDINGCWAGRDDVIPIPRLPRELSDLVYIKGMSLENGLRVSEQLFSRNLFIRAYLDFGNAIRGRLTP